MKKRSGKTDVNGESKRRSFFFHYIDIFFEFCYNAIFTGLFGKLFTSYSKLEKRFTDGFWVISYLITRQYTSLAEREERRFRRAFPTVMLLKSLEDY